MKKRTIGHIMMIVAIIFSIIETRYFGNNMYPESIQEVICDSIGFIAAFTGFVLVLTTNIKLKLKN
jgi:hypothetical protein